MIKVGDPCLNSIYQESKITYSDKKVIEEIAVAGIINKKGKSAKFSEEAKGEPNYQFLRTYEYKCNKNKHTSISLFSS